MGTVAIDKDSPATGDVLNTRSVRFDETAEVETNNFSDMAFYHMLLDAYKAKETIAFKARPIFRSESRHPMVDALDVDRELVVKLLYDE